MSTNNSSLSTNAVETIERIKFDRIADFEAFDSALADYADAENTLRDIKMADRPIKYAALNMEVSARRKLLHATVDTFVRRQVSFMLTALEHKGFVFPAESQSSSPAHAPNDSAVKANDTPALSSFKFNADFGNAEHEESIGEAMNRCYTAKKEYDNEAIKMPPAELAFSHAVVQSTENEMFTAIDTWAMKCAEEAARQTEAYYLRLIESMKQIAPESGRATQ